MTDKLDDVDREILHRIQDDARNNSNSEIAEDVGVSPSTISKRIKKLERSNIISGYTPNIDYNAAGYPLHVLFICNTPITERAGVIEQVLEIPGVVNVKELMSGNQNLHIEVVGREHEDITQLAIEIGDIGAQIIEEVLVKSEAGKPASVFKLES